MLPHVCVCAFHIIVHDLIAWIFHIVKPESNMSMEVHSVFMLFVVLDKMQSEALTYCIWYEYTIKPPDNSLTITTSRSINAFVWLITHSLCITVTGSLHFLLWHKRPAWSLYDAPISVRVSGCYFTYAAFSFLSAVISLGCRPEQPDHLNKPRSGSRQTSACFNSNKKVTQIDCTSNLPCILPRRCRGKTEDRAATLHKCHIFRENNCLIIYLVLCSANYCD